VFVASLSVHANWQPVAAQLRSMSDAQIHS
jgi:hypothetical protein